MTRVVDRVKLEDCLDSTVVKEFRLSQPLDEPVMHRMATEARLQYFPNFPKPYFRIERRARYVIQGILGKKSFRVTFSPSATAGTEATLCGLIEDERFDEGGEVDDGV